jgi:hypothetical protein
MSLESASQAQSALTRKDRMQQCYMTCGRRNNKIAAAKRRCWKSRDRNSCRGRFEGRSYNRFRSRHRSGSWALINLPVPDLSSTLNSINPIQATARNGRPHFCPSWNACSPASSNFTLGASEPSTQRYRDAGISMLLHRCILWISTQATLWLRGVLIALREL